MCFGEKTDWVDIKKFMNGQFLSKLQNFDTNTLSPATVKKINADLSDPDFNWDTCCMNSAACCGLYVWIWNIAKVRSLMLGIPVATKKEKVEVSPQKSPKKKVARKEKATPIEEEPVMMTRPMTSPVKRLDSAKKPTVPGSRISKAVRRSLGTNFEAFQHIYATPTINDLGIVTMTVPEKGLAGSPDKSGYLLVDPSGKTYDNMQTFYTSPHVTTAAPEVGFHQPFATFDNKNH